MKVSSKLHAVVHNRPMISNLQDTTNGKLDTLLLWVVKDGKRGHENQSVGLIRALAKLRPVKLIEINVATRGLTWLDYLMRRSSRFASEPKPDLIIGAGSRTHATILGAGRATGAFTVVLMSPPKGLRHRFDLCIAPEHDAHVRTNVITTRGALNLIEPSTQKKPDSGLILIGGPSKHHRWDGTQIVDSISQITRSCPGIRWTATTSPRSPASTYPELTAIAAGNLEVIPVEQTDGDWLPAHLAEASFVWVSEDSVSMIYEALSSGAKVGVLPVPRKPGKSRVIRGVDALIKEASLLPYSSGHHDLSNFKAQDPLNEAERVAGIVIDKFSQKQLVTKMSRASLAGSRASHC